MFSASGLGKRYGSRWLFRRVELQLALGECLLVTGPNGSGKSTLLRLLAGLEASTEGSVAWPEGDHRRTIGYMSPELRFYAALSAWELLGLTGRLRGVETDAEPLLRRVGLWESREQSAGLFSTGMKARLRIAVALQARPSVLLLDEPGSGLDEEGKQLVSEVVKEQRGRGCVIVATNEQSERGYGDVELKLA